MNSYEIRNTMLWCAEAALSNSLVWSKNCPEEEELVAPVCTVRHLKNLICKMFERYEKRVGADEAKGKTYFIHVGSEAPIHPIYIVGTLTVLLLAGVDKIWIEYPGSYTDDRERLQNPTVSFFIEEIVKKFPNIQAVKHEKARGSYKIPIEFVNAHSEIGHVVDIGGQVESYERLQKYRKNVWIHVPSTNFIWVDYRSREMLKKDEKLENWGERCSYGIIDYECFCANYEEELYRKGFDSEKTYSNCYTWEDFLKEFIVWRLEQNVCDKMYIYNFGDAGNLIEMHERLKDYGLQNQAYIIDSKHLMTKRLYYDFMNILREMD